jgi:hypothetical protein
VPALGPMGVRSAARVSDSGLFGKNRRVAGAYKEKRACNYYIVCDSVFVMLR